MAKRDETEKLEEIAKPEEANAEPARPTCGIIMPISAMGDYSASHWSDVLALLQEVTNDAEFDGDLVSNSDETSIIHKTIVQNVYKSDIVICDVSGKNANVMFELGLRLAFDKATIIIKDEATSFSFDTSPIEHLVYPTDLRYARIVDFKKRLKDKILATYKKSKEDPNYSTFLKSFGEFKIAHIETKEVTSDQYILQALDGLRNEVRSLKSMMPNSKDLTSKAEMELKRWMGNRSDRTSNRVIGFKLVFPPIADGSGSLKEAISEIHSVFKGLISTVITASTSYNRKEVVARFLNPILEDEFDLIANSKSSFYTLLKESNLEILREGLDT